MKKRTLSIIVILAIAIATFTFLYGTGYLGKRPFKDLGTDSLKSAAIFVIPPEKTVIIQDKVTLEDLAEILGRVKIYQRDESGREYNGQLVQFTITLATGDIHKIGAFGSFIFIDDICYKTKYEPSEELNVLGNRIIKSN